MSYYIKKIIEEKALGYEDSKSLFTDIVSGNLSEVEIASILTSMKIFGETSDELAGAIYAINKSMTPFEAHGFTVDTCGTGGDGKSSINVSSAVSIILAASGIKVVKHGNSSQSGKLGSADIFEMLGIPTKLEEDEAKAYFNKHNFIFLLAPIYHPAMKYVASVRKEMKIPTIFNLVGPMSNPAKPSAQIIGVSSAPKLKMLTQSVKILGRDNITLYSSRDGYDEVSTNDITDVVEIRKGVLKEYTIDPSDYFDRFNVPIIENEEDAINKFISGLEGRDENLVNLLSINTALGFVAFDMAEDIEQGFKVAKDLIKTGEVYKKFKALKGNS